MSTISRETFVRMLHERADDFEAEWARQRHFSPDQFGSMMLEADWWDRFSKFVEQRKASFRPSAPAGLKELAKHPVSVGAASHKPKAVPAAHKHKGR